MSLTFLRPALRRQLCLPCLNARVRHFYASASLARPATSTKTVSDSPGETSASANFRGDSTDPPKPSKKAAKKKPKKPPPRNLLEDSKLLSYLDYIAQTSSTVTLADITRLRPDRHAEEGSPQYEQEYGQLLDRICRSFSKKQLVDFVDMLDVGRPLGTRTKHAYGVQIIEKAWGWPSLTEIQRRKRDWSEVKTETFPLDPRQSFLILGQDGADLLAMSADYNVHITFSSRPLSLRVEGLRGALKQLRQHVTSLKEEIEEETYKLPSDKPIHAELLQRISRLSGAFAENFGVGMIRVSFKRGDPRAAFVAKRLATHASCDVEGTSRHPLLTYTPPSIPSSTPIPLALYPFSYALYPFLSPRSLPWMINANGAFRIRKVAEWLGMDGIEDIERTGGLALGRGRILDLHEQQGDIQAMLLDGLPKETAGESRVVTASLGHVLLAAPRSSQPSIVPPLSGDWPLSKVFRWMREQTVTRLFTSSLPPVLLDSPPQEQKIIHRLTYQARPTQDSDTTSRLPKIIQFEMLLPMPSDSIHQSAVTEASGLEQEANRVPSAVDRAPDAKEDGSVKNAKPWERICRVGHESTVDLMIPDRPTDIRFSVFDSSVVPEDSWPDALQAYVKDLLFFLQYADPQAVQPDTPLTLHYQDTDYLLRSSASVRQNSENPPMEESQLPVRVITESILDLEVNEKSTGCKILCDEISSPDAWQRFLRLCDRLSSSRIQSRTGSRYLSSEDSDIMI